MPASKDDVVSAIGKWQREIAEVSLSLPEAAWSNGVYEQGWNAKQLLCHLAAGGGFASFLITFAQAPPPAGGGSSFDQDAWNAAEVASRQAKPVLELLDELRRNTERSIAAVESAPEGLLGGHFRAALGNGGHAGGSDH